MRRVESRRSMLLALTGIPLVAAASRAFAAGTDDGSASRADAARTGSAAPTSTQAPASLLKPGAKLRAVEAAYRFMTTRDGRPFERGRETAGWQFHDDGTIAVRIHSESDSPRVVRDAIYTLDAQWRPRECLLRVQVDGHHEGSGWFRFESDHATLEGWNAKTGRVSQRVPLEVPASALVAHPVTTDAMLAAAYVHGRGGPSMQRLRGAYMTSADPYGRTGPLLSPNDAFIDYAGRTNVETPLGAAEADLYRLHLVEGDGPAKDPLEEMWCLAGTTILLRARALGSYQTTYELVALTLR
jgi:hypothetical protein